jgi:hypothetical protein
MIGSVPSDVANWKISIIPLVIATLKGNEGCPPTVTATGHDVCPATPSGTNAFICQVVDPFVVSGPEL